MRKCKICKGPVGASRERKGVLTCNAAKCREAQKAWIQANWDQLPEGHTGRRRSEREFWEINDTQREHYSHFFSLIRPPKTRRPRNCLKCGTRIRGNAGVDSDYRTCHGCQETNSNVGALA